jgi:hypothetical protein
MIDVLETIDAFVSARTEGSGEENSLSQNKIGVTTGFGFGNGLSKG